MTGDAPKPPGDLRAKALGLDSELEARRSRRVFLIVLDSLGIGELPDAPPEDAGAHTLDSICRAVGAPEASRLLSLGLGNIAGVSAFPEAICPEAAFGRMAETSPGKDTTTGHWELAGVPLERAFPTFPDGFSEELLGAIAEAAGIPGWLGNEPASGTEIIERLGPEHVESGKPIVYTSADSVLQIAAHEDHFGLDRLLALCAEARDKTLELGIARIIARPFVDAPEGSAQRFERTYNRRDFSLTPPAPTVLDALKQRGVPVVGVGKIEDIFAGTGVTLSVHTKGNDDGMRRTTSLARDLALGLVFVNLVDFDMAYGHRRDAAGYRGAIEAFDAALAGLEKELREEDLVILTADHGNDPTNDRHTDHTREFVPLIAFGERVKGGLDLGTRTSFADVGATIAEAFGVEHDGPGTSFLGELLGTA